MIVEIGILILAALNAALAALSLRRTHCARTERESALQETDTEPRDRQAELAEKRFSEGVLNVLAYENPAGREEQL